MKILFLSLLLLNAGYLGYNLWNVQSDETHGTAGDQNDSATLRLVDESTGEEPSDRDPDRTEEDDDTASVESPPTEDGSPSAGGEEAGAQCHAIGPMPSSDQIESIQERARDEGLQVMDRWSEETEMPRYWVHIPPADDMGTAREILRRLEQRGVEDIQLINSGRMARGISLGLFSTRAAAERRETGIRVQGFDTNVREVAVQAEGHWIVVRTDSGEPVARSLLQSVTRDVEGAEATRRPCDEIES
ncbi:MAG: hypothetical protein ACQERR_06120 [Pseudomonadota bacterium]